MSYIGGNPTFRQCPKCLSSKGTSEDCQACEQTACSECCEDGVCESCREDLVLALIADAVASEVELALQPDLQELSLLARAGCDETECRVVLARDRRES